MVSDERFDVLDYCVFGGMLVASALIGVYFAFCAKQKQNSTDEYLLGGRKLGIFPMSMSLVASNISAIYLVGMASEMYSYGTQLYINIAGELTAYIVGYFLFLPVLHDLKLTTVYEYFGKRFNLTIRKLVSILFLIKTMFYMPIVIYMPALAFAQVTGMNLRLLIVLVCVVCIFYTSLGGLKAVVWTDTLQTMLIFLGVVTVSIIGTINEGGFLNIWKKNQEGNRIEFFNFDPDPTLRHSFWTVYFGKFVHLLQAITINQSIVQRYLAMPTLESAKKVVIVLMFGMFILFTCSCYSGLVIYAAFHDCDPVLSKKIQKYDQILPYYVMKTTSNIPALPGVFVAGLFSASLSTISTCLNSWTGVLFEDFIRPNFKKPISELRASFYMKVIVAIVGTIVMLLATFVDKLGGVIQTSGSFSGMIAGGMTGIFITGTLLPWVNSTGVLIGGIVSAVFVGWVSIGTQFAIARKEIIHPMKPFSVDGCDNATLAILNTTLPVINEIKNEPFFLYKVSYVYYPVMGALIVVFVSLIVSWFTGMNKPCDVDPSLLSPVIRKFIKYKEEKEVVDVELLEYHKGSLNNRRPSLDDLIPSKPTKRPSLVIGPPP